MNQLNTRGIVLGRTDYGEADRIITVLTPDHGKLRLMARGVRRVKSKLAGGIELFSTSDLTYIKGRGEIGTLISARLIRHYGNIAKDIERVQLGYDLIKQLNRATEDNPEEDYYELLEQGFKSLDDETVDIKLIRFWFQARLLYLAGYQPNLTTATNGDKLQADRKYMFDFDAVAFNEHPEGLFDSNRIKVLRLAFSADSPKLLSQVRGIEDTLGACMPLAQTMLQTYIRT